MLLNIIIAPFQYDDYDYHTGDPMLDREYERQMSGQNGKGADFNAYIPEPVKKFLVDLRENIAEGNTFEVANLYENSFPKLTEQFFKSSPWPEAETVSPYVQDDPLFIILYRELYYR